MRPVTILHDLMKPIHANGEMTEKNLQFLEEYLDLLIRTFEMAEAATMLLVVLHINNLRPMYKKWWSRHAGGYIQSTLQSWAP